MEFDLEALCNVYKLQESKNLDDQKRLLKLVADLSTDHGWQICASVLMGISESLPNPYTLPENQRDILIFLCYRAIENFLRSTLPINSEEAPKFASFLWQWLKQLVDSNVKTRPKYIQAKTSHLICLAILRYYPKYWTSVFDDILLLLRETTDKRDVTPESWFFYVEIFLDVLVGLDASLVSRDVQLTTEELKRSNEIKQTMRTYCNESITNACFRLLLQFMSSLQPNVGLVRKILSTLGLYADWVDLRLVVNTECFTLLVRLLECPLDEVSTAIVRSGLYAYLLGIFNKGMPTMEKLQLLNDIWDRLGNKLMSDPSLIVLLRQSELYGSDVILDEHQLESLCKLAALINAMGVQLINAYKNLHDSDSPADCTPNGTVSVNGSSSYLAIVLENIESKLNIAISLSEQKEQQIIHNLLPFLRSYLGLLKSANPTISSSGSSKLDYQSDSMYSESSVSLNGACFTTQNILAPTDSRMFLVRRLFLALLNQLKSLPIVDRQDDEDEYEEHRHNLHTLIGNVIQLNGGFVLDIIHQTMKDILNLLSSNNIQDSLLPEIHVTLSIFYLFGESLKALKNDYFAPTFPWHSTMIAVMSILCSPTFPHIPNSVLQIQYFDIMVRYEKYFTVAPHHLSDVMLAFIDERGLHSPWKSVRVRCAYLIGRLIKPYRKPLSLHTDDFLSRFADLLELRLEPDISDPEECKNINQNDKEVAKPILSLADQGFLYEAIAQLIAAGACHSNSSADPDRASIQLRTLLNPVLSQYNHLVTKFAMETDSSYAEARGLLIKEVTDLITRTSRVLSLPKSPMSAGCERVFIDALRLVLWEFKRFPFPVASPGRAAACSGVRSFLNRMFACLTPTNVYYSSDSDSSGVLLSEVLMDTLVDCFSNLVHSFGDYFDETDEVVWSNGEAPADNLDTELRLRDIKETVSLVTLIAARYKPVSGSFILHALPLLLNAIATALRIPVTEEQMHLAEEIKPLHRSYLQMVQAICQSTPIMIPKLIDTTVILSLSVILKELQMCFESNDPLRLRSSLTTFVQFIQMAADYPRFYDEFLIPRFIPFCIIAPTSSSFRTSNTQYVLVLNDLANCLHNIAHKQPGLATYLEGYFASQLSLPPELIQSYINALKSPNVKDFQSYIKNFYIALR